MPSSNIIPPSPPPLPDIEAPRSHRGRGKGVRGYQKGLPTSRKRRGARLTQTSTQVRGDTANEDRQPQAAPQVRGDTANEDRQPQAAPQVRGDTANEDRQPQAAPQVHGDTANEDRQPQAAPQVRGDTANEDRQPQAAPQFVETQQMKIGNPRQLHRWGHSK